MGFLGNPPFDKEPHQLIRSADWNDIGAKLDELDAAKVNRAGDRITGDLVVDGNLSVDVVGAQAKLHVSGGQWNLATTEGDFKIGNAANRLKIGVATAGGGAGDVRIRAEGGTNRLMLGGGANDVLTIREDGVGIGAGNIAPAAALHVDGDVQVGDNSTERRLTVYGPYNSPTQDGALIVRGPGRSTYLRMDRNEIDCSDDTLFLNYYSKRRVQVGHTTVGAEGMKIYGNLHATGNITANGSIGCHITDRFINQSGDTLEQGDVVILGGRSAKVFYGVDDNIPVPEADLTTTAYDHRVCGIVSEILVEEEPQSPEAEKAAQAKGKARSRAKAPRVYDDGVKRLQVFSAKELEKLDTKQIGQRQVGKMVTLGCFAHCKVDADIAAIKVGDLLTTSPTKGHAQKVLEPGKAIGAIIGKALGSLKTGKGKIPVLVMLQ